VGRLTTAVLCTIVIRHGLLRIMNQKYRVSPHPNVPCLTHLTSCA